MEIDKKWPGVATLYYTNEKGVKEKVGNINPGPVPEFSNHDKWRRLQELEEVVIVIPPKRPWLYQILKYLCCK